MSRHAPSGSVVLLLHSSRSVVQFGAVLLSVVTEMQQKVVERCVKTLRSVAGCIVRKINSRKGKASFCILLVLSVYKRCISLRNTAHFGCEQSI